ncbi:efflux protein EncT [Cryptococcus neoformans var. grubii H99]|uniref:Efflux protein EncT n=1 Tax=Cryptococcus neoformans (strain H99 / ATCC 208821 / CBS 10515 / FGSC 9487) TaxID=235443 RepID=J9VEI7_CRYN9|nr:efflux protein EncT [Cryptococcus neoformans var. grubii H99]AFR92418.2 efflux protein EncT [Cryptococcus neoformans var. grubii H99]AUB21846.1 efflux protein EncT [Cryptococcus neoformans var. grubii]|eukprot:XP_012046242.1 efflux protein EncT [Cryptococcus neoformans var. grubii H99]
MPSVDPAEPSTLEIGSRRPSSDIMKESCDKVASLTGEANTKDENSPPQLQDTQSEHILSDLSTFRKTVLLLTFALANFIDVCNVSGVAIAAAQISQDIGLGTSQVVWIITSYSLCFSAFLLFSGRLSDLFPAGLIFESGLFVLGVLSLATSFVTSNKYAFLILRGLGGIVGSMAVPSSYHLTVHMYPESTQQAAKLAILGLAGGLGNVFGLVLAGLCMKASYHWFFRVIAILCILSTAVTIIILPHTGPLSVPDGEMQRWKRMDVPGVVLIMGSLICFMLSLTQGPINGWRSASFIAPFVLSWPLGIGFFVWEANIPPRTAILPSTVWNITNSVIASLVVLVPMGFWGTSQLLFATYWQTAFNWAPLHVAAAMLPQGLMTLAVGILSQFVPAIIAKPRYSIPIGAILVVAAEVLQIKSNGGHGKDYWRFLFPAFIIGSAGSMILMFASSVNFVQMCPPEMAGVAGAWTSVLFEIGGAVTLAVQAGMEKPDPFTFMDVGAKVYYFIIGWTVVLSGVYVAFYKQPKALDVEHEETRKRIMQTKGDMGV